MAAVRVMQCHYEVLGVAMDADTEVIRKAYRKAALEWHPDKNMHRIEEATVKFQLISDAYQVLSDPKERAWYDTHRESILRGGDGTFNAGSAENFAPNIYQYFSPQSKATFYEFYSKAFEEISNAERSDAERQGKPDPGAMPLFGSKDSAFAEVKRFYALWEGFNSKMSFAWMDKYDTREAENRYQRRYVEKLNETERTNARREYVDAVRSLVDYVKKRDERWALGLAKMEAEEREKREKREKYEAEKKAAKAAQKEALRKELEEERAREEEERRRLAAEAGEDDAGAGTEEEEEDAEHHVWSCGVCSKEFKSEKQLLNHEASKKHKDAVKAFLKKGGKLDEVKPAHPPPKSMPNPPQTAKTSSTGFVPCPSCGEPIAPRTEVCPKCEMPVFLDDEDAAVHADATDEEEEPDVDAKKQQVPAKQVMQVDEESNEDSDSEEDDTHLFMQRTQKNRSRTEEDVEEDEPEVDNLASDDEDNVDGAPEDMANVSQPSSAATPAKKIGKAKQKRLEKEARSKTAATQTSDQPIVCAVCKEEFTSRSKLFKHVEEMDHAVPPDEVGKGGSSAAASNSGGKGKKNKKRG